MGLTATSQPVHSVRWSWWVILGACAVLVTGCGQGDRVLPDAEPPTASRVASDDAEVVVDVDAQGHVVQRGRATTEITTASIVGGEVRVEETPDGGALRFPSYAADASRYPRAALTLLPGGGRDALSPGPEDFSWGAEIALDKRSAGNDVDNGDNVLQRGLASQDAQFKLELDGRRPACAVKGSLGEVSVRAADAVEPGVWYRVLCERFADTVTVTVTRLEGAERDEWARDDSGPIGTVDFHQQVPLAIGGKVGADGALIASATDQFNGLIRQPMLAIDGATT